MQYFTLRKIDVIGDGIHIAIDQSKIEDNLLFIRPERMKSDIISNNNQIEDVTIRKRYPDTLVLSVVLRKAIARLTTTSRTVIIDSKGIVLGYARSGSYDLPLMAFGVADVQDGIQITETSVLSAIALLKDVSPTTPFSSLYLPDSSSIRAIYGKTSILFPLKSQYSTSATTLQTLIARFRMKGSMPTTIDLRFDKPVIRM
jgi:cell division septal protein FtsQ